MNLILRSLACIPETLLYGPVYGSFQFLIRSPKPLDADFAWRCANRRLNPVYDWIRKSFPPPFTRRALIALHLRQEHFVGLSKHYDIPNEFFELFLDKQYMFYTCADFVSGDETLEEAQQKKARLLVDLLDPHAGEKIADLGCGWGGMLREIHARTGDKSNLVGYTLSKEHIAYNEQHNGFHLEFKDFVADSFGENEFDKFLAVGSMEHVKPHEWPGFLRKIRRALKPGGRFVIQCITRPGEGVPTASLVTQIFFPGSLGVSYGFQMRTANDAGLRVAHQSMQDYRPTLRAWFDRLVENRERAIELVGVRTYNRFLMFFAASHRYFDDVIGTLVRLTLEKPVKEPTERKEVQESPRRSELAGQHS